jgi:hypothetical protein
MWWPVAGPATPGRCCAARAESPRNIHRRRNALNLDGILANVLYELLTRRRVSSLVQERFLRSEKQRNESRRKA